jgi:hypothetical protein
MKQIHKLFRLLADPRSYGIKKNSRAYGNLLTLAITGEAVTGYSSYHCYYVDTTLVGSALSAAGIAHRCYNVAPRGGACGERVALAGKVLRDARKAFSCFAAVKDISCGGYHWRYDIRLRTSYLSYIIEAAKTL